MSLKWLNVYVCMYACMYVCMYVSMYACMYYVCTYVCTYVCMYRGADTSLARPERKQARKHVRDARDFNKIETRTVIRSFSLPARQGAEGNSRHSDRSVSLFPSWSGQRLISTPVVRGCNIFCGPFPPIDVLKVNYAVWSGVWAKKIRKPGEIPISPPTTPNKWQIWCAVDRAS